MGKKKKKHGYLNDSAYKYDSKKTKKKKKNKKKFNSDYSDINYHGNINDLFNGMADSIEGYLDVVETYIIFEGMTEDEFDKYIKEGRKFVKKLRNCDQSVLDIETFNEVIETDHQLVIGMK